MHERWLPAVLACAGAWLGGCHAAPVSAKAAVGAGAGEPSVAETLRLPSAQAAEHYEFTLGACTGTSPAQQCEFSLRLVRAGAAVATLALDPVWSQDVAVVRVAEVPGAGDPLGSDEHWHAWRVGSGDAAQNMAARSLRVAPGVEGVLLHRVHGGAARDALVLRRQDQDQLSLQELPGRWSALAVRSDADRDRLLLLARVPGEPGFVWANDAVWNASEGALRADSEHDPTAHLAVLGPYPSLEAAQPVAACWSAAVVLSSDLYEGLPPGAYFVGVLSSEAAAARSALTAAQGCAAGAGGSVVPLGFRWLARERYQLGPDARAEVGLGRYDGEGWPLVVALLQSGRTLDRLKVSWPANAPVLVAAPEVELPTGDPLQPARGAAGWALGSGEAAALAAIRTLRLGAERSGLLISMQAGFEHLSRRHDLVVANGARLSLAWSAVDPQGPAWSSVVVRPRGDGTEELLHFAFFADSEQGQPDRADVTRLVWDSKQGAVARDAGGCAPGVFSSFTGAFASFEAALAARDRGCAASESEQGAESRPALVLEAPSGTKGYALAQLSADKALLGRLKTRAAQCGAGMETNLRAWCAGKSQQ